MAGVEFKKFSSGSLGDADIHFDLDKREVCDHSNRSIDKSLVKDDYYIGASSWQEIKKRIKETVAEADEKNPPKRVRADRKHWFGLEVPCPPELEGTPLEDKFYSRAYEVLSEDVPLEGAEVHKDEKHEYYDPKKESFQVSRNHMHCFGACLTADGRINAHDLITQELCQKVNDKMQKMCLEEFGISYQTGEGRKGARKTVEELKAESETSLQAKLAKEKIQVVKELDEAIEGKTTAVEELDAIVQMNSQAIFTQDTRLQQQREDIQDNAKTIELQTGTITNNKKKIEAQEEKIVKLDKNITERQSYFDNLCGNLMSRFRNAYASINKVLDHFFNKEMDTYTQVVSKMIEPMKKGSEAMKNIYTSLEANEEPIKKDIDNLEEATEELEDIVEDYEEDLEL